MKQTNKNSKKKCKLQKFTPFTNNVLATSLVEEGQFIVGENNSETKQMTDLRSESFQSSFLKPEVKL